MRRVLAIDQGTTNTKAVLVGECGEILASASRPVPIRFPQPGWVEQDPMELWRSVEEAAAVCMQRASGGTPDAIGISNQRESAVAWDRQTGEPIGPCIGWQCRRTADFCSKVRSGKSAEMIVRRTGLPIDPVFSASKMRWLLSQMTDGYDRAAAGDIALGTVDSWMLWNLTGGKVHACDLTNASRTQLLNLRTLDWDDELLAVFGIPRAALPVLHESSYVYGHTRDGVPIAALVGDSHAALFGHAIFSPGAVKATYGTGTSLMTLTDGAVWSDGLTTAIGWSCGETKYALEGNIFATGGAVQWAGEFLGLAHASEDAATLAGTVHENGGVYFVPAFSGLGAPHWNDSARGTITGLTRGSSAAHLARAAVEAIAYQIADVFGTMERAAGREMEALQADGGGTRNGWLMQFQADILDRPVVRCASADVSAMGAAWLAGLAGGVWSGLAELSGMPRKHQRFEPRMAKGERERLLDGWRDAVRRACVER